MSAVGSVFCAACTAGSRQLLIRSRDSLTLPAPVHVRACQSVPFLGLVRPVRARAFIAVFQLFATSLFASEFHREIPRASWEPIFFRSIDALTRRAGWQPLRAGPVPDGAVEVRIWIGFGLTPLEGYRLRRDGERWSAQHVKDSGDHASRVDVHSVSPKSGWPIVWRQLTDVGILTLTDSSALPRQEVVMLDGISYVVEINHGNAYRTYEYGNPQVQRWPEAKKIEKIVQTLQRELPPPKRPN